MRICTCKLLLLVCFAVLHINCSRCFKGSRYSPSNSFSANDVFLSEGMNLFASESEFSKFCDLNMCDFSSIRDIAASDSHTLCVLNDFGEILIMNSDGLPRQYLASYGQGPGEMTFPSLIKVRNTTLYVLDRGNNKIVIFDLTGRWLKDIVIHDVLAMSFDIDAEGNIYVPRLVPSFLGNGDTPLFHVYDQDAKLKKTLARNEVIQDDLLDIPATPLFCFSNSNDLLLGLNIQGVFYLLDDRGELLQKFDIRHGSEWKESLRFQRALDKQFGAGNSWRNRVDNVSLDSHGDIYATFGGEFRKKRTIAMIFNDKGEFVGRLFGNELLPFAPTCFSLANDSTAWLFSREKEFFGKCKLIKKRR